MIMYVDLVVFECLLCIVFSLGHVLFIAAHILLRTRAAFASVLPGVRILRVH